MRVATNEPLRKVAKGFRVIGWSLLWCFARLVGRRVIVVEVQLPAQWEYVGAVMDELARSGSVWLLVTTLPSRMRDVAAVVTARRWRMVDAEMLKWLPHVDVFVSASQYTMGIPRSAKASVLIPHGLPSKGNSVIARSFAFSHVFLTGPMLEELFQWALRSRPEARTRLLRAGYPRSDPWLRSPPPAPRVPRTVLFAPSFEEGTSLFRYGEAIVERLLEVPGVDVWVKLHPVLLHPDWIARNGRNWSERLAVRFADEPRVAIVGTQSGDGPLLAASALVTDVSGIAWEFLLLGRGPIVYLDCPDFYRDTAPKLWEIAGIDSVGESVFVGRDFGLVTGLEELPETVAFALSHPEHRMAERRAVVDRLLFHPGHATQASVELIWTILGDKR